MKNLTTLPAGTIIDCNHKDCNAFVSCLIEPYYGDTTKITEIVSEEGDEYNEERRTITLAGSSDEVAEYFESCGIHEDDLEEYQYYSFNEDGGIDMFIVIPSDEDTVEDAEEDIETDEVCIHIERYDFETPTNIVEKVYYPSIEDALKTELKKTRSSKWEVFGNSIDNLRIVFSYNYGYGQPAKTRGVISMVIPSNEPKVSMFFGFEPKAIKIAREEAEKVRLEELKAMPEVWEEKTAIPYKSDRWGRSNELNLCTNCDDFQYFLHCKGTDYKYKCIKPSNTLKKIRILERRLKAQSVPQEPEPTYEEVMEQAYDEWASTQLLTPFKQNPELFFREDGVDYYFLCPETITFPGHDQQMPNNWLFSGYYYEWEHAVRVFAKNPPTEEEFSCDWINEVQEFVFASLAELLPKGFEILQGGYIAHINPEGVELSANGVIALADNVQWQLLNLTPTMDYAADIIRNIHTR